MKNKKVIKIIAGGLILYLAAFGVSYMIFTKFVTKPISISTPFGSLTDVTSTDEQGTKDQPCPLNGAMYTKGRKDQWTKRRPLAIMVENHVDARPISGLSRADIVYEAVAEGGITRFMGVFLCQDSGDIAPVRSARTYFIDWLSEYSAAYAHVGGANTPGPANALGQIKDYGIDDMDQFGLGFPTYWRGTEKLAPHNVHTTTKKLWEAADKRNFGPTDDKGNNWDKGFITWKFKDDAADTARGDQKPIVVPFWVQADDYTVTWQYDKVTNTYKRYHGTVAQIDPVTNENLAPKNVVVQLEPEKQAGDGYPDGHLLYNTIGSGNALFFQDGKVTKGKWTKTIRTARSKYTDLQGMEIQFNRGLIWIQTIPAENVVKY